MNEEIFDTEFDDALAYGEDGIAEIDPFYNRHYITTRPDGAITDAWSDGPHPEKGTANAICINEQGGYQFQMVVNVGFPEYEDELFPSDLPTLRQTEENPPIYTEDGIPLYRYSGIGGIVILRPDEEIAADRAAIPAPPPSAQELLRADVDSLSVATSIAFVTLAETGSIDDVTAGEHPEMFAGWASDIAYAAGNIRRYGEQLYRCLQAHSSQTDWTPDKAVSLWTRIADPAEMWPEWSQPVGAHDAYAAGDQVSHNGIHWVSGIDGNIWEPGVYGWTEVS